MTIETIQAACTAVCVFGALLLFGVCFFVAVQRAFEEANKRLRGADKKAMVLFAFALTFYAGAKHALVPDAGADEGVQLVSIATEYDSTNDVTSVEVKFTGSNVTTETPISVRNDQRDVWRELQKIGATVTTDFPTNVLAFAVSGNVGTNHYWWAGWDTPAVIIETAGITVNHFAASSSSVEIMWTCDDPKAVEFSIQRRRKGTAEWETVGVTSSLAFIYVGFTVGETWEWRVMSTYREGDE